MITIMKSLRNMSDVSDSGLHSCVLFYHNDIAGNIYITSVNLQVLVLIAVYLVLFRRISRGFSLTVTQELTAA